MKLAVLLAVGALVFASCAAPFEDEVRFDVRELSAEQQRRMQRAADRWDAVSFPDRKITFGEGGCCVVHLETPDEMEAHEIPGLVGYWYGNAPSHGEIAIVTGLSDDTFEMVAEHELGHAIGVEHHEGPGVMNPHAGQIELSPEDIAQCRKDRACP